ncbi:MAG: thioredoxin [Deltaproteobacteria bacterium]|nr:thioredoxin [Deltaproteobacteria bacterium]
MASKNLIEFTDGNFDEEVLNSNLPVLIDLWASWCAPCHMISPIVEELADEYAGKIKVGKLNVDQNPNVPGRYNVRAIPTLLFFKDGKLYDQIVGVVPKSTIEEVIKRIV